MTLAGALLAVTRCRQAHRRRYTRLFIFQVDNLCVQLSPIFEEVEEGESELECSQLTSETDEKPPSLTEQALGLKQALTQLAELVSGQVPSVQAEDTIRRLRDERCGNHSTQLGLEAGCSKHYYPA